MEINIAFMHKIHLIKGILMSALNIPLFYNRSKKIPKLFQICLLTWHYD